MEYSMHTKYALGNGYFIKLIVDDKVGYKQIVC